MRRVTGSRLRDTVARQGGLTAARDFPQSGERAPKGRGTACFGTDPRFRRWFRWFSRATGTGIRPRPHRRSGDDPGTGIVGGHLPWVEETQGGRSVRRQSAGDDRQDRRCRPSPHDARFRHGDGARRRSRRPRRRAGNRTQRRGGGGRGGRKGLGGRDPETLSRRQPVLRRRPGGARLRAACRGGGLRRLRLWPGAAPSDRRGTPEEEARRQRRLPFPSCRRVGAAVGELRRRRGQPVPDPVRSAGGGSGQGQRSATYPASFPRSAGPGLGGAGRRRGGGSPRVGGKGRRAGAARRNRDPGGRNHRRGLRRGRSAHADRGIGPGGEGAGRRGSRQYRAEQRADSGAGRAVGLGNRRRTDRRGDSPFGGSQVRRPVARRGMGRQPDQPDVLRIPGAAALPGAGVDLGVHQLPHRHAHPHSGADEYPQAHRQRLPAWAADQGRAGAGEVSRHRRDPLRQDRYIDRRRARGLPHLPRRRAFRRRGLEVRRDRRAEAGSPHREGGDGQGARGADRLSRDRRFPVRDRLRHPRRLRRRSDPGGKPALSGGRGDRAFRGLDRSADGGRKRGAEPGVRRR